MYASILFLALACPCDGTPGPCKCDACPGCDVKAPQWFVLADKPKMTTPDPVYSWGHHATPTAGYACLFKLGDDGKYHPVGNYDLRTGDYYANGQGVTKCPCDPPKGFKDAAPGGVPWVPGHGPYDVRQPTYQQLVYYPQPTFFFQGGGGGCSGGSCGRR